MFTSKQEVADSVYRLLAEMVEGGILPRAKYRIALAKDLSEAFVFLDGGCIMGLSTSDSFSPLGATILAPVEVRK